MYQSNRSFKFPPPGNPPAFEFLENFCSDCPPTGPKSCSNAPTPEKLPDYCFNFSVASIMLLRLCLQCTGQFQSRPSPPGQTPWHLTFLKTFGQIPRYVASLDFQMPHPLELQRGSNPPPSRHVKASGNKFCNVFSHYQFLVQLVFAPHFKQRHIPRYNYIKRQQQKNPRGIDKSNDS